MFIKFEPSACKDVVKEGTGETVPKTFEGYIKLQLISHVERLRIMSKCKFKIDSNGVVKKDEDPLDAIANMIEATQPYFGEINLVRLSDKKKFSSYEEMSFDQDCFGILTEASSQFLNGFKLGNGLPE